MDVNQLIGKVFGSALPFGACLMLNGCATHEPFAIDQSPAHLPSLAANPETTNEEIVTASAEDRPPVKAITPFELPNKLPGADAKPIVPPRFGPETTMEEKQRKIRELYPQKMDLDKGDSSFGTLEEIRLNSLIELSLKASPAIRAAEANLEVTSGAMIQAGLYPNPTIGYQADQWIMQKSGYNTGQQGGFVNQRIMYPGKLTLAQSVARYDYLNAVIAVRKTQIDLTNQVRTAYYATLVAQQSVETNRLLVQLFNETYDLQLKQVAGGEAAGYEPLQLYAQTVQAKNSLIQAENTAKSSWQQLTAAIGVPDLQQKAFVEKADASAPVFSQDELINRVLENHTEVVTAKNTYQKAQVNLELQKLTPYPDLQTNSVFQHDNAAGKNQFNLQVGVSLPLFDRNQGNIASAMGSVRNAQETITLTQNRLRGQLSEVFFRYETNRVLANNYREKIIPNLTRSYRSIIRRYQVEPDKVSFNDVVVAQQNLSTALQSHLSILNEQWKALADLANTAQLDALESEK